MLDNLEDFYGTPMEREELLQAQISVRRWLKSDCGWGRTDPVISAPVMNDQPGIEKEETVVTPRPSSREPRYGINGAGKKSHRPGTPETHICQWEGCSAVLGGNWRRCPEHVRLHRAAYKARKAAKQDVCNIG